MSIKKATSNLPEIPYGKRPKVLLVGNGINLSFDGATDTDDIIKAEWKTIMGQSYLIETIHLLNMNYGSSLSHCRSWQQQRIMSKGV